VDKHGWKPSHIEGAAPDTRKIPEQPIPGALFRHSCLLLMPRNYFLILLKGTRLGDLPEIIDKIRKFETTLGTS